MADEPQKPAPAEQPVPLVPTDKDPEVEKAAATDETEKVATTDETEKAVTTDGTEKAVTTDETEKAGTTDEAEKAPTGVEDKISQSVSFKEESNVVGDLPEAQKKALDELKKLIQEALNKHELTAPPEKKEPEAVAETEKKEQEVPAETEKKEQEVPAEGEKKEAEVVTEEGEKKEAEVVTEEGEKKEEEVVTAEVEKKEAEVVTAEVEKKEAEVVTAEVEKKEVEVIATEVEKETEVVTTEIEKKEVEVIATEGEKKEAEVVTEEGEKKEIEVAVEGAEKKEEGKKEEGEEKSPEEVDIWGIPLVGDERSDVILLKFLRARDFKVKDAFTMIKNSVRWRKEFGIEGLVEEDLGNDWDKVVFSHGYDKEGHPVCYNVFGEFENKELYQKTFSDEEKRQKFIRWRIQVLENSVRKLELSPTGISSIVQVNDLKNSPGLGKWELRQATNQALQLLQDNYPEFVAKQIFINVPWWYLAFSRMISAFLTQRTKSKFVFAGPSKSAETLFKYIAPEQVPVQYGGLSRDGEQEFSSADPVTEVTIKPATKHAVHFPVIEKSHLIWEIRVVGWDVTYGAEFVPTAEDGYTVIVQKSRKIAPADETVISNTFKTGEPGKIVLTVDNQTSKKKKLLYRSKIKPISE
ncbi:hypothetical protein VNO77_35601 [Canavalia gladiata]|uniref:Patellin-3 n=1 Tax=Canavalia gladiata TaxID=3824 RepID=A0AAN9K886_CANGL